MISTHVLDTSLGRPAAGVWVELDRKSGDDWTSVDRQASNSDGRIVFNDQAAAGTYRLQFHLDDYFRKNQITPFFTIAPVIFQISDLTRKYHVPLLLNPYGYSTYRGS